MIEKRRLTDVYTRVTVVLHAYECTCVCDSDSQKKEVHTYHLVMKKGSIFVNTILSFALGRVRIELQESARRVTGECT